MDNEEKDIGLDFCDKLHSVLLFAMEQCYNKDWSKTKEMAFTIPECFDLLADEVIPIHRLSEYYDDLEPNWVGFALTKDLEYIDFKYEDIDFLKALKRKVENEISRQEREDNEIKELKNQSNAEVNQIIRRQDLKNNIAKLRKELDWGNDDKCNDVMFWIDLDDKELELDGVSVEYLENQDGVMVKHIRIKGA